jgi:hypothetical protein
VTGQAVAAMAPRIGTRAACVAAGVAQASWYRRPPGQPGTGPAGAGAAP